MAGVFTECQLHVHILGLAHVELSLVSILILIFKHNHKRNSKP